MKVAIYVEGITEAGFVYQLIGEKYHWDWTKVQMECLNLAPRDAANDLRDFGSDEAPDYFLIYDSGSDTSVVSDIRGRFQGHMDQGFDRVVGLRDVYRLVLMSIVILRRLFFIHTQNWRISSNR